MKKSYVSPVVRFEGLQLREDIANVCWGYNANGDRNHLYYDTTPGYMKITLNHTGGCGNNASYSVSYENNCPLRISDILVNHGSNFEGHSFCKPNS